MFVNVLKSEDEVIFVIGVIGCVGKEVVVWLLVIFGFRVCVVMWDKLVYVEVFGVYEIVVFDLEDKLIWLGAIRGATRLFSST